MRGQRRNFQQPDWMARVVVGSVFKTPSGDLRLVRKVSRRGGKLGRVTFAIRHCSWTGRAYTIVNASDLIQRGFQLMPVRVKSLDGPLDVKLHDFIHGNYIRGNYPMKCCDARGLP